ncbi:hypothetical protein ACVC7V_22450 [Hydrogenophaga sp. A37]|uniref:hypothetical protein n=1 Tax=Hydrogenophaga sp. A37 TaxID=1945864 RepID=UPI000985600D|nr:hypothetical protein [Hydrogenophaga sp. A37]OOG85881.1 hypothetical protein B0E41_07565 [Hydrogenophaga sp. A37]
MHTEHLYQTLSPQAYAALLDRIRRQAVQERRLAVLAFGQDWPRRLWRLWQRLRFPIVPTHPQKA